MDNTKHSSTRRQHEIQMALRAEYSQGAVNEMHVARLLHEMSALPHRHVLNEDKVCGWCFYGLDEYTMPWPAIEAKTREYEAALDTLNTKGRS